MTDDQLVELIQTQAPEDFTLVELDQLRRRLSTSPQLQEALAGRLELEQYLADRLGIANVSADQIIDRAGPVRAMRTSRVLPVVGWILCLALVGFIGLVVVLAIVTPPGEHDHTRPIAGGSTPADESAPADRDQPDSDVGADDADTTEHAAADDEKPDAPENPNRTSSPAGKTKQAIPPATTDAKPEPKPVDPATLEPWDRPAQAPQAGAVALFEELGKRVAPPRDTDLRQWFAAVKDQQSNISQRDMWGIQCGVFDGLVKLRAPWRPQAALRLSLYEYPQLKIHFFSGQQGISLHFYEYLNQSWAAYATTRKAAEPKPATYVLAATDEDRYWRTNPIIPATFELRYEPGLLVLSRGDVRVLSAPLAEPPTEVYFEGHAIFRQIALVPAAPLPPEDPPRASTLDIAKPADLTGLLGDLPPGASFDNLPDGCVELTAEKTMLPAWVALPIPTTGVHEIIAQLDQPSPGTGFYLGDAQGKPRYPIGFFREQRTGLTSLGYLPPGDARLESNHDVNSQIAPYAGGSQWLRVVFGCGIFKCWSSIDGQHWARAFEPITNQPGDYQTIGLFCVPGQPRHSIKLRRLALRELAAIDALAPKQFRDSAVAAPAAPDLAAWIAEVNKSAPQGASAAQWRRACAVRTLARGTSSQLGTVLIEHLLDYGLADSKPTAEKLKLLDEAALLLPTWEDAGLATRTAQRYERIGQAAYRDGETRPYQLVGRAQMTAPIWCRSGYTFPPDSIVKSELLELIHAGQWQDTHDFCRRQKFWRRLPPGQQAEPTLVDWADAVAMRSLPKPADSDVLAMRSEWRHPLITELNKEGYNFLAELDAALEGKSYDDACRIISTEGSGTAFGVLPDSHDPQLLISLADAVALAMRDHPELQAAMNEKFGPLGLLRVRQATVEADTATLEAATLQFYGTAAAAEAHAWLGDQELSAGAFTHALGHYRQARLAAPRGLLNRIAASEQLAAALMGQAIDGKQGAAVSATVEMGDARLSPAELEQMLADLRTRRAADGLASPPLVPKSQAPVPSGFEMNPRGRIDGDMGDSPQEVPGDITRLNVDWVARQYATVFSGDRLLVSNRFQVAAFDLNSGQAAWRTGLGGEQSRAHDWSMTPMRPVIAGGKIFVRRLPKSGPGLVCLELASGKLLWKTPPSPDKLIVSDPLVIQDELFALTAARVEQESTLSLTSFDPQTGSVLGEQPLIQFRETWFLDHTCQALASGNRIIVVCGGSVFCCDTLGQLRWVRRQTWVPSTIDRNWVAQSQDLPLLANPDGKNPRLFVAQPGVKAIVCLDPDSGRQLWQKVLPDARRILGLVDDRLIVETGDGLTALAADSGKPLWYYAAPALCDGQLCGGPGGILIVRSEQVTKENNFYPLLVWLDPKTGREQSRAPLAQLRHERPKLGPLLVRNDHLWTFFGRGDQDPNRDLIELIPKGSALPADSTGMARAR